MAEIKPEIQRLLNTYEVFFNGINASTQPRQIYRGHIQLITDYEKITTTAEADVFFSIYTVGNTTQVIHNPFERQLAYELLLQILQSLNPTKYHQIHKGTPYYFIGWTTYQHRNFSKAIFYMDAAVSEDLKRSEVQNKSITPPAIDFFLLKSDPGPTALATHLELQKIIINALQDYRTSSGGRITLDDFRKKFVVDLLYSGPKERSLLTALYTFVLEYQEKELEINLRSDTGGSIQSFLDHLFDGARILESLLEKKGDGGLTLRPKIVNTAAIAVNPSVLKANSTLADAEIEFNNQTSARSSFQDCNFASAFIIRNTAGHSLLWPDQFRTASSYSLLYKTLLNSIFWTVEKLWP